MDTNTNIENFNMGSNHKDLIVYRKSFDLAMRIFEISKHFPKEEIYSLTDQLRRSSRAIAANLAESYAKRLYTKHFVSKLTDAAMENRETQTWLEFSLRCKYITEKDFQSLNNISIEIGKILTYMIQNPQKFSQL